MLESISKTDFYNWAFSDLLTNNLRGILAEYIVAKSLGTDHVPKIGSWNEYDITYKGLRVEVKSSAYIQSWDQEKHSSIQFSIEEKYSYDTDQYQRNSDVYVFCHYHHKDKKTANPLNLEQWSFYIVKTEILNKKLGEQKTLSLSKLHKLGIEKIAYNAIKDKIDH